ncbi:alpha/beta-hydrolase [Piromyces finnis]|uniref:Alpha/beta-hydrolase n=1 Tax=Piromyces finnis TaxID=1754191 RepID=A0A1Y1V727_9FUNG|nr:alpha/beta-hydrolase [Piromyces finnis]|eukprot:ORX48677.1 alpha/beta-hydrolase [Piromyces finnis]
MKSSLLIKLFSFIAVAVSIYASPISKKYNKEEKVTLTVDKNVNYYHDLDLDVYYQKSSLKKVEKKPVVIYIYGGAWCSGNKEKNAKTGEFLNENGYISVLPNYHVFPNATNVETMVDEIHHAIQWTNKNIHKYGGDKKRMTIVGHSAGSHLTALTLVKSTLGMKNLGKPLKKLPTFKDVLLLNGPYVVGDIEESIEIFSKIGMIEYAEAFKGLFLNKTGYNPQDILAERKKKSIKSLGTEHITFLECTEDMTVPLGSADPMIEQVKRTVKNISIKHVVIEGEHNTINHGIRDGDEEAKKTFINLVKKYNKL